MKSFFMNLCDIQPSQLYISKEKLKEVDEYLDSIDIDDIYPIPIKKIGNNIFFTDGHTRAFALYRREVNKIKVCWDEDDLSWVEYIICLDWCNKEGIKSIADLKNRIVDEEAYKKLWLNRCYEMQCKVKKDISYYLKIKQITDIELKSKICNEVLRSLPDWFGIEEAIVEYVQDVKSQYFLSAFILAFPVAVLIGIVRPLEDYLTLTLEFIRHIPPIACIPMLILWLGIGEASKIAVIILAAFFPIFLNTLDGVINCDKKLLEVGDIFGFSEKDKFFKIILPSAMPSVIVGMKLGLGYSWRALIGAELIAASSGIGYMIMDAEQLSRPDIIIVGIITIGLLGYIIDLLFFSLTTRLPNWNKKGTKAWRELES